MVPGPSPEFACHLPVAKPWHLTQKTPMRQVISVEVLALQGPKTVSMWKNSFPHLEMCYEHKNIARTVDQKGK